MTQPFDRLETESDRAWAAFKCYRDMSAPTRSIEGAYRLYAAGKGGTKPSGSFNNWYADNNWRQRTIEWDLYVENESRENLKSKDRDEFIAGVQNLKAKVEEMGSIAMSNAARSLKISAKHLDRIESLEVLTGDDLRLFESLGKRDKDSISVGVMGEDLIETCYSIKKILGAINKKELEEKGVSK